MNNITWSLVGCHIDGWKIKKALPWLLTLNSGIQALKPYNAESTFVHSTRTQRFSKPSKPYIVGIHWKALAEYFLMSTHLLRFQSFFFRFLQLFLFSKLATSSIRVKPYSVVLNFPNQKQFDFEVTVLWEIIRAANLIVGIIPGILI